MIKSGATVSMPRWQMLTHLALHSTQHRAEAAEVLTAMGRSPGDLDFMRYVFDRRE